MLLIRSVKEQSDENQLAIQVELDCAEKNYQEIKVKINNGEWDNIEITGKEESFSNVHIFENLQPNKMYTIVVQVTKDGLSSKVGRSFITNIPLDTNNKVGGSLRG